MFKISSERWRLEILTLLLMAISVLKGMSESYFVKTRHADYGYRSEYLLWRIILHSTESCVVLCHTNRDCLSVLFDSNTKECHGFMTFLQLQTNETLTVNGTNYFQMKVDDWLLQDPSETTTWNLSLYTGTHPGSGTDNQVIVSILGTKAALLDRKVESPGDDHELGKRDDYQLVGENIGVPIKIKISLALQEWDTDRWFLHKVEVSATRSYTAVFNKWFDINTTETRDLNIKQN